jgi:predicted lipid-binding transport protein (Tim44 family)
MTMKTGLGAIAACALVLWMSVGAVRASAEPSPAAKTNAKSLTGEAARASDPGKAVVAIIKAARKGDRTAVKNLLLPEVVKDLEITIDIVDADQAKGRVGKTEGSVHESTGMTLKRVGGVWKISL